MTREFEYKTSRKIVLNLAEYYDDIYKVIAEFVDNSIDASEKWYDKETQSFLKPINIEVVFQGSTKKTAQISIKDNCIGMDDEKLQKVFQNIGDSDKKSTFTNGQFGFGIFSGTAFFDNITFQTLKFDTNNPYQLQLNRKKFAETGKGKIEKITKTNFNNKTHGTSISLSNYRGSKRWSSITKDKLVNFLNVHFERFLATKNLNISITDNFGTTNLKPFNYNEIEGSSLIETWDGKIGNKIDLRTIKTGQNDSKISGNLIKNVESHFRITEVMLDKKFFIAIKGRRINSIKDAFKGNALDLSIWNDPFLTGFLDLADFAEPDITRTKIVTGEKRKTVMDYLKRKENDIKELLQHHNKEKEDKNWEDFDKEVNNILKDITKEFDVKFSSFGKTKDGKDNNGGLEGGGKNKHGKGTRKTKGSDGPGSGSGTGGDGTLGENFPDDLDSKKANTSLRMKTIPGEPPLDRNENQVSSYLNESGVVYFYNEHPEFVNRVNKIRGKKVITQRLATFLGIKIGVHFLDKYIHKGGVERLEYNKEQLESNAEFVLSFEDKIQPLINKPLGTIVENEN